MNTDGRRIVVTGADGFIGKNLMVRLAERGFDACPVVRNTPEHEAAALIEGAEVIFHLAGANRPADPARFMTINRDLAAWTARHIAAGGQRPLVVVASSAKVDEDSDYGRSKLAGEQAMLALGHAATVSVWRLPNVFGKWARPDYNSAVATFCHNLARGLEITLDDPLSPMRLLFVDDLIDQWLELIDQPHPAAGIVAPGHVHDTSVGELASLLRTFAEGRNAGRIGAVGQGLARALYATYVSYLPASAFSYRLTAHVDPRGSFTEVIRTPDCGQVSALTIAPGATRGGHYHHAKVEKFVVLQGSALFRFLHILTGEMQVLETRADAPTVVETIPGWAHDITNIGDEPVTALVWASETFDPAHPDTLARAL